MLIEVIPTSDEGDTARKRIPHVSRMCRRSRKSRTNYDETQKHRGYGGLYEYAQVACEIFDLLHELLQIQEITYGKFVLMPYSLSATSLQENRTNDERIKYGDHQSSKVVGRRSLVDSIQPLNHQVQAFQK